MDKTKRRDSTECASLSVKSVLLEINPFEWAILIDSFGSEEGEKKKKMNRQT